MPRRHRRRPTVIGRRESCRARRRSEVASVQGGVDTGVERPPGGTLIGHHRVSDAPTAAACMGVVVRRRRDAVSVVGHHLVVVIVLMADVVGTVQAAAEGEVNHHGEGREQTDDGTCDRVSHHDMVSVHPIGRSRIFAESADAASPAIAAKTISVAESDWKPVAASASAGR